MMEAFLVMAYRQLLRFARARAQVAMVLLNPLLWLAFFGLSMSRVFGGPSAALGGLDYMAYLAPGVAAMAMFFGSFMGGLSVIWDRQFGFLRETLVAPASRAAVALGRAFGDSLVAVLQGTAVVAAAVPLARLNPAGIPLALLHGLAMAMGFASLGTAMAARFTSVEGFQMAVNLLTFPMLFASGIFFPLKAMPPWLQAAAYLNPLTYAVEGLRFSLTGVSEMGPHVTAAALLAFAGASMALAARSFREATAE